MRYTASMQNRSVQLVLALMASAPLAAGEVVPAAINDLLAKHCVECHGRDQPKAGLDLVSLQTQSAAKNLDIWGKVGQAVITGDMPPSKRPRLDPLGLDQLRTWI